MSRSVVVSAGASEPRSVIVTDRNLNDLGTAAFTTQLAAAGTEPAADRWVAPANVVLTTGAGSTHPNVAEVIIDVSASNATPGNDYRQWVRLADGPNVFVLPCPEIFEVI